MLEVDGREVASPLGAWVCAVTTLTPRPPLPPAGEGERRARARASCALFSPANCQQCLTVLLPSPASGRGGEARAIWDAQIASGRGRDLYWSDIIGRGRLGCSHRESLGRVAIGSGLRLLRSVFLRVHA